MCIIADGNRGAVDQRMSRDLPNHVRAFSFSSPFGAASCSYMGISEHSVQFNVLGYFSSMIIFFVTRPGSNFFSDQRAKLNFAGGNSPARKFLFSIIGKKIV